MSVGLEKLPKTVYHATTTEYDTSLKNGIDLNAGRSRVDYGKGFYTTSNFSQAKQWATFKTDFRNQEIDLEKSKDRIDLVKPLIISYKIDIDELMELKGKVFTTPNLEWAKYVIDNRLNNINLDVDYAYGPLADSRIAIPIREYKKGKINIEEFCRKIYPKYQDTDQMSFHTFASIGCLERNG